jgi:hypothetical protein
VVPYWVIALASTAIAAAVTGAANAMFIGEPRTARTVINAVAYMLAYGVLFFAKYCVFHRWLFAPRVTAARYESKDDAPLPSR